MSYKKMVVIFIDIIGYKNIKDFRQKYELHRLFHEEVNVHYKRQAKIPHVIYDRKIYAFSDCAFFFFFYKDGIARERKNDANLIFISSYNTSLTILRLMNRGYLIRGGVAFGDAFFDDLGFFGPAVEFSHEIEEKFAIVPRVQFDKDIGKVVYEWEHNTKDVDPMLLKLFKEPPFLIEKEEGEYFINPLFEVQRSEFLEIGNDMITIETVKRKIVNICERDKKTYSNNSKIIYKLDWIKRFVESKELLLNTNVAKTAFSTTEYNITEL